MNKMLKVRGRNGRGRNFSGRNGQRPKWYKDNMARGQVVNGLNDWGLTEEGPFGKRTKWSMAEMVMDQIPEDEMAKDEMREDEVASHLNYGSPVTFFRYINSIRLFLCCKIIKNWYPHLKIIVLSWDIKKKNGISKDMTISLTHYNFTLGYQLSSRIYGPTCGPTAIHTYI